MAEQTIALVTGANKGIGYEIARKLGARGMTVALGARDAGRREKATAALRAEGADVHPVELDVTSDATVRAAAVYLADRFGRLDVLVNNAGISGGMQGQKPTAADLENVLKVFDTNVFGVIRVTNAMTGLLRRSAAGRVVNVSSVVGSLGEMSDPATRMYGLPPSALYAPSKTALNSLTVQYAKEFRGSGVLVNAVCPGGCATDFTHDTGFAITRTAADGAEIAVVLATIGPDGPTGGYFDDTGPVRW
jgi:NAD(P)-dependent dehydrogenase (short-subunit alcohol dehydrogenase family)